MARRSKYSPEVRARAVRMVLDHVGDYGSLWEATRSVAGKFGCSAETLRKWIHQAEVDSGRRGGISSVAHHLKLDLRRHPVLRTSAPDTWV